MPSMMLYINPQAEQSREVSLWVKGYARQEGHTNGSEASSLIIFFMRLVEARRNTLGES